MWGWGEVVVGEGRGISGVVVEGVERMCVRGMKMMHYNRVVDRGMVYV